MWDGVRNAQAQKHMKSMRVGDRCLFYHSSCAAIGVVGIAEVAREAYPEPGDASNKYVVVDLRFVSSVADGAEGRRAAVWNGAAAAAAAERAAG